MAPRLLALVLPVALLASVCSPARAVTEADFHVRTVGDLVDLCTAASNDPMMTAAANFCEGFAVGVYQTLSEEQPALRHRLFCAPEPPPTRNQAIADFTAWAKANPAVMSEPPADGILRYLSQRYPCASR